MAAAQPLIHYDSFSQCPYAQVLTHLTGVALIEEQP